MKFTAKSNNEKDFISEGGLIPYAIKFEISKTNIINLAVLQEFFRLGVDHEHHQPQLALAVGEVDAEGLHVSMLAISRRQCTHCLVDSVLMDATSRLIVGSERPAASDCAQPWDKRSTCSSFRPPLPSGLLSSGDHPSHRLVSSPRRLGSMDDRLLQEKLHIVWGSVFLTAVGALALAGIWKSLALSECILMFRLLSVW